MRDYFYRWRNLMVVFMAVVMVGLFTPQPSYAVNPDEVLSDPVLEKRARELSTLLRCLVCQNQSIDDSDALLARDLRVLVRDRLVSGDSDNQVLDYIVSRYGEFVLLQPRWAPHTILLWVLPIILIFIGLFLIIRKFRKPDTTKITDLSKAEQMRISKLLK